MIRPTPHIYETLIILLFLISFALCWYILYAHCTYICMCVCMYVYVCIHVCVIYVAYIPRLGLAACRQH